MRAKEDAKEIIKTFCLGFFLCSPRIPVTVSMGLIVWFFSDSHALPCVWLQVLNGQMSDRRSLGGPLVPDEVFIGCAINQVACVWEEGRTQ